MEICLHVKYKALLIFCNPKLRQKGIGWSSIFFYLTDAFETVDRDKLLCKINNKHKISGRLMGYLRDFLKYIKARIQVNAIKSEWRELN